MWTLLFCILLVELVCGGLSVVAVPSSVESKKNVIFPKDVSLVPKCSNARTFCEDIEPYPEDEFYRILETTPYEEEYFSSPPDDETDITGRKVRYLCETRRKRYYPKVAENARKEWKYVYNFDKYRQYVTTEECISTGSCTLLPGVPRELKTKCVQKYSDRLLLVADKEGNPEWDLFWFPSACVCTYKPLGTFKNVE